MNSPVSAAELRASVQQLVRALGLLELKKTPCGQSMPVPQAHALLFLMGGARGVDPSLKILTEHLSLDKSTVSRLVRKMSDEGLVDVESSPSDGRVKRVSLTQSGQELAVQVDRASLSLFEGLVARLSVDAPDQITTLLGQLTSAIRAVGDTTPHEMSG